MMEHARRLAASVIWRLSLRRARNRRAYYGGAKGLRAITFHRTPPDRFAAFTRTINWCQRNFQIASPEYVDELFDGKAGRFDEDRILITFDDGHFDTFAAAEWLHEQGIKAYFFIMPSYIDRTAEEFVAYHRSRGVDARYIKGLERGLTTSQLREMIAMGHRIGAHNDAHRDLGRLHSSDDLEYEISNAIDSVAERTGTPCRDFAIAFGQPENISDEAIALLRQRRLRVFACFRGLNVPGISPAYILRHGFEFEHPFAFTTLCLQGGADHSVYTKQVALIERVGVMPSG